MLPETIYNLSGKVPFIFVNHTEEEVEISIQQRLGTIHRLAINKKACLKGELRGRGGEQELGKDDRENYQKILIRCKNLTEESKKKFICESFGLTNAGSVYSRSSS